MLRNWFMRVVNEYGKSVGAIFQAQSIDGQWAGVTSQNLPVIFTVLNNNIQSSNITFVTGLNVSGCETISLSFAANDGSVPISSTGLAYNFTSNYAISFPSSVCAGTYLSISEGGSFTSFNQAFGSFAFSMPNKSVTWTAKKQ